MSLAMLQGFVRNQGDAWEYTKGKVDGYFDGIRPQVANVPNMPSASLIALAANGADSSERHCPSRRQVSTAA